MNASSDLRPQGAGRPALRLRRRADGRAHRPVFAAAWIARSGDPYSDRINSTTKYVVSSTLRDPEWNNTTVISGGPIPAIRRLKEQPGQDIVQYGFGQLSCALLEHGLLDSSGNVTYTMRWLSPPDPNTTRQPGDSWQDSWSFTPRCSSGACNVTLNGAYDGYSFTSALTRSGTTYSGTAELKGYWYCTTPGNSIIGTLTITIKARSAAARGAKWVVKSFSGTVTVYFPAAYTCHDDTAQLALKSG